MRFENINAVNVTFRFIEEVGEKFPLLIVKLNRY